MSSANVVFNLCSRRDSTRKALVSLMRASSSCSLDELIKFYQQRAIEDAEWLRSKHGILLQDTVASPTAQQGGSVEQSQPKVQPSTSAGVEVQEPARLEGTPLTAKKSSKDKKSSSATATNRPSAEAVSPMASALGLSKAESGKQGK